MTGIYIVVVTKRKEQMLLRKVYEKKVMQKMKKGVDRRAWIWYINRAPHERPGSRSLMREESGGL